MKEFKGQYRASQGAIAIVVSRFNDAITKNLLEGALDCLKRFGYDQSAISVAWTPGSFEIPLVAQQMANSGQYKAIICLGAVIEGETAHFDYVCSPVASAIASIALSASIPVIFGILTTHTVEQAIERSGVKAGNKGFEAALNAIEMIDLLSKLPSSTR